MIGDFKTFGECSQIIAPAKQTPDLSILILL